ncbi:MAG: hypothetical protein ABJC89_05765 [Acidobacteriota bacterium]
MPRFRHKTTFGIVSRHEWHNADRFFADLLGRGGMRRLAREPGAELFYEALVNGHAPAPRALSEADEAYAEGPPDPTKPPTVTAGANADEIVVTRADGTRFIVRRKVRAQVLTRPGRPRAGFCKDDERVFFRVSWCEGTQGTIDIGAKVQGAFKDLIGKVFTQINQGATPGQIKQTFENASVQTFLDLDITKVASWKITGDVKLDINRTGLTSASVGVSADRGWVKLGVQYTQGADGKQVMVTADFPLGGRKIAGKDCPVRELIVWWDVECLREVPFTLTLKPPVDAIEKHEQMLLYFDYAKASLRRDPKSGAAAPTDEVEAILQSEPTTGTGRLNKRALERLDYLVGQGYWLGSVAGYTSPEGRRTPPRPQDRGAATKWEGNDALSLERAEKVLKLIGARYGTSLRMRSARPDMRFPAGQQMPKAVGQSENPKLNDRLGKELEGAALDRAVILGDRTLGVKAFLEEHPNELSRMTAEDQEFVNNPRNQVRARAERLFENLRRVEIHLRHLEPLRGVTVPSSSLEHMDACPQDLIEAAERKWGSRIPFIKRDPPLCS